MTRLLRDYDFQISYGPVDDRLHRFYIPALERSVQYDRSAGFFSSSALAVAAAGVARLIENRGRMRLLVGAQLSDEDVAAIEAGYNLSSRLGEKLLITLEDPETLLIQQRLEVLAWMVAEGTLEIRVVLPTGPDGQPFPASQALDYYHPKEGIFTDQAGNQIAFSGSINESAQGWQHNYEQFAVYRSWDASQPYLAQVVHRFERLWQGTEQDWVAIPIPDAVRDRLISFRPDRAPTIDPLEVRSAKPQHGINDGRAAFDAKPQSDELRERIVAQFLRDAPYLPTAGRLGASTSAVSPWPHQDRVSDAVIERFPERFLIADEVGLGKTIEAGLAIRQLLLSGRVRRCLILTPKSVLRQWQEELYEKFLLDIPRYEGGIFVTVFGDERPITTDNPFDSEPVLLASSQLVKRRDRKDQLLAAQPWDLVIVDEAHHARRKDFLADRYRPNRLLELLLALKKRTQGMVLLTATPMQVAPVEVWDLLMVLGLGGRWGADERNFLRFFREIRKSFDEVDWNFVFDMVRDYFRTGGTEDSIFAETARRRIGLVDWESVRALPESTKRSQVLKQLSVPARAVAVEFAKRHTPLRRFVFRNTRALLREYVRRGLITATIPDREPRPVWIPMEPAERELYHRIEEYIADFYAKYEAERKGLGFIMTVYRRRLTSSFYAIERSLERRLRFLKGLAPDTGLDDDDLEEDDLEYDVGEEVPEADRSGFHEEIRYVEDFLHALRQLSSDSKLEHLVTMLNQIFRQRETVVIFTQYTDTMDYLREQLREVYGAQVACYSGRGGEEWRDGEWVATTKEEIKNTFREGERTKILLCTEAASEGLNLQTCGVLINYDMPWNPMRVEQRIGRIDRIGQRYPVVWIRNYFYEDTIEATVYQRLSDRIDWFQTVVGDLQPILARVAKSIQMLAMLPDAQRAHLLDAELAALRAELDQQQVALMSLDEYLDGDLALTGGSTPLTLADLERTLTTAPSLKERFKPHPTIEHAYLLARHDGQTAVTFDPAVFDEHPDTVRLMSYGDRLLDELLAHVEPLEPSTQPIGVLRCASDGAFPLRAYYLSKQNRVASIDRLADLEQVLGTDDEIVWTAEASAEAERVFGEQVEAVQARESEVSRKRREAERLALVERGRQILLQAALVEIARGQRPNLFDQALPWEFSEQAISGLKRHKHPFAPLLRLVDITGLSPSPADSFYLGIQNESDEMLRRRFEQLRLQASDLVKQLVTGAGHDAVEPDAHSGLVTEFIPIQQMGAQLVRGSVGRD